MDKYLINDIIDEIDGERQPLNLVKLINGEIKNNHFEEIEEYRRESGHIGEELEVILDSIRSGNRRDNIIYTSIVILAALDESEHTKPEVKHTVNLLKDFIRDVESNDYGKQTSTLFKLFFFTFVNSIDGDYNTNVFKKDKYTEVGELFNLWAPLVDCLEEINEEEKINNIKEVIKQYDKVINKGNAVEQTLIWD